VVTVFANNLLWTKVAESDFNSAKQFMQTIGLQIDEVAWTVGQKATVRYPTMFGELSFLPSALNYSVYVKLEGSASYDLLASYSVGVLLFNVPVSRYSLSDGYFELIYPPSAYASNLTFTGTSAPVARVFAVEKLTPPMEDGSFTRVVVAPSIRSLFSEVTPATESTYYMKLYLPVLVEGSAHGISPSVTLTGSSVLAKTRNQVDSVRVTVDFPTETAQQGFDSSFFQFPSLSQVIDVPEGYSDSVVEVYSGQVEVEIGAHA
jgi:hypothetical protein